MIQCRMGAVEKASEKETPPAGGQARKRQPVTPPESERELQQTEERQQREEKGENLRSARTVTETIM